MEVTPNKILKVIHYCWFGGKEKPKIVKRCINSWKRHPSDKEIIEWNESLNKIKCFSNSEVDRGILF